MKKPVVFMFSGQGSQYYQMGKELYEKNTRFKLWMDHCDEVVKPLIQSSLIDIIYAQGNDGKPFDQILYTNPALLSIEYSLARLLIEMNIQPDYLLGYSLGEFTALVISGVISLEDGLHLMVDYANLLESDTPKSGMLAIIDSDQVILDNAEYFSNCWLTGKNFKNNFVVSGLLDNIQHLQAELSKKNILTQRLAVNYGFHTQLIDPIDKKFRDLFKGINFSSNKIPIISSFKTEEIKEIHVEYLWELTRYPVNFEKTIQLMQQRNDFVFIDVGPSGTLSTFVKYILPKSSGSLYMETINQFGKNLMSIQKLQKNLSDTELMLEFA